MVKSLEQQITFLDKDLVPLYGFESLYDAKTIINTENLAHQEGFLVRINTILPLVTLFYPVKKFNLHKIDNKIHTHKQAFSLLVHCLEISQIPHTIWTKKYCRRNIQFLRLNPEKCVHRSTTQIDSIQQSHKSMTQSQTKTQQIYQMVKNATLEEDGVSGNGVYFTADPQVTQFSEVSRRTTHYRRFPVKLPVVNGLLTLNHEDYKDINSISELMLVFKVDKYVSFDQTFAQIIQVMVKIGDTSLFDLNGSTILSVLKLHPEMYQKSFDSYKSGTVIIPIQYLLMFREQSRNS
jgi:hypothetical protein